MTTESLSDQSRGCMEKISARHVEAGRDKSSDLGIQNVTRVPFGALKLLGWNVKLPWNPTSTFKRQLSIIEVENCLEYDTNIDVPRRIRGCRRHNCSSRCGGGRGSGIAYRSSILRRSIRGE